MASIAPIHGEDENRRNEDKLEKVVDCGGTGPQPGASSVPVLAGVYEDDTKEELNEEACHETPSSKEDIGRNPNVPICNDQTDNRDFPFNREMLEGFFEQCPASYIANFRSVCNDWNKAAFKAWRNEAQVTVVDYYNEPRQEAFKRFLKLPDLMRHTEDPNDPLKLNMKAYYFKKYKLESWYLTDKNASMVSFWGILGPSIHHLHLSNLRIEKMDTLLGILYEMVPNLGTLILDQLYVVRPTRCDNEIARFDKLPAQEKMSVLKVKNLRRFPLEWREFLGHFPGIKTLESVDIKSDENLQLILEAVRSIKMQGPDTSLQLKSLVIIRGDARHRCVQNELSMDVRGILAALVTLVPLEELHLKLGCRTTRAIAGEVLQSVAESLRKLTFHVDFKCGNSAFRFPYRIMFPLLEDLELWQWCKPKTNLHLLFKSMPNLQSVKIDGIMGIFGDPASFFRKALDKNKKDLLVCNSMKDFSFAVRNLNMIRFNYLFTVAPNITKLELNVGNEIFREICKNYSNLVELRVCGKGLTDEGVIGEPSMPGTSFSSPTKMATIRDLEKLRVFVMHDTEHLLTDKSVFHGFLKLPSLLTLQMSFPGKQITQEARQELEKNIINLVVIKWRTADAYSTQEDERENFESIEADLSNLNLNEESDEGNNMLLSSCVKNMSIN